MRNVKLIIEYDGTRYRGWQIQNARHSQTTAGKKKTVQQVLEKTLSKILREKIKLTASGRTDAGVHALCQVANFKTNSDMPLAKLERALNGLLPEDISIAQATSQNLSFHSRFHAKSKVYRYTILNRSYPSPLLRNTAFFYPYNLNIKLMREEAGVLLGKHNFSAFKASGKIAKDSVRTIKSILITSSRGMIYIDIEADGFLHKMARNIVGTLIEIGRQKMPKGSLKKILLSRDRRNCGPTAIARGLCLMQVKYY